ncbi:hypothetical protein [Kineococcus sp. SYSU DK005]|uniref:hypothetical protein n=1 Tax=Kineococcus sp. SYSU DK005 TaxID=3383126 RepID=UPI003D7CE732
MARTPSTPASSSSSSRSPVDLVADLRAYGMSIAEIAHELNRSPRMVRKIVRGETSGEAYRTTLTELVDTGRATTRPARRRDRTGQVVPVRAPRGATTTTVRPAEQAPAPAAPPPAAGAGPTGRRRRTGQPGTGTAQPTTPAVPPQSTTYLPGGARQHSVRVPQRGRDREAGRQQVAAWLRAAARGQRAGRKNVRFTVHLTDGRAVTVGDKGGYAVSAALARSRAEGQDPFAWLNEEIQARYADFYPNDRDIVGVDLTIY